MERERGAEEAGRRRYDWAGLLMCVECGTFSDREAWGWRAYHMNDSEDRGRPAVACYCPTCAEREFEGTTGALLGNVRSGGYTVPATRVDGNLWEIGAVPP
jgi:hypothetical protein